MQNAYEHAHVHEYVNVNYYIYENVMAVKYTQTRTSIGDYGYVCVCLTTPQSNKIITLK